MIRLVSYAVLAALVAVCSGCKTLFKMQLPPAVENNFQSDRMHPQPFRQTGTRVFGYQVKKDSVIYAVRGDTTLTFGLIFPRSRIIGTKTTQSRLFSSDSRLCRMLYNTQDIYLESQTHSMLTDIILPPEKYKRSYSEEEPPGITWYYRYFNGSCRYANDKDSARFYYEQVRQKNDIDTALITGRIYYGSDSLVLKPYYLAVTQNAGKNKYIYILEGFGFYKQNRLLAFLQYAPLIKPGHETLYLSPDASADEQLLMSAYFTLFFDRL